MAEGIPIKVAEGIPIKVAEGIPIKVAEGIPIKVAEGIPISLLQYHFNLRQSRELRHANFSFDRISDNIFSLPLINNYVTLICFIYEISLVNISCSTFQFPDSIS